MWFQVQYFCPRQSPYWQGHGGAATLQQAIGLAQIVKPPAGSARVIDYRGVVVYQI